eukprot:4801619-Ditylum_brightwellii.AAC.1
MGYLHLDKGHWQFSPHKGDKRVHVPNLGLTYQSFLDNELLLPGCHSDFIAAAATAHVSASGLALDCPNSLFKTLHPSFADRAIWYASYMEEVSGLIQLK